jgi:TRAP-type C4-dicarboxylate transport system substrate-binding protein
MRKPILIQLCLIGLLIMLSLGTAQAKTSITLAHHGALNQAETLFGNEFKSCMESDSATEFVVAHYPAGQLGKAREIVEQVKIGAIDMTISDTAYLSNLQPELTAWMLPFIFSGWDHAERAMAGKAGEITAGYLDKGLDMKVLSMFHSGFRDFMTIDKKLNSLKDFEGVKFRSPPIPVWVKMFETLKAIPVTVDWSEVYTALRSGLVEGFESSPEGFLITNSPEIGKYITKTGHMYNAMIMVVSNKTYNKLSDAEKRTLNKCSLDMTRRANPYKRKICDEGYAKLKEAGMTISDIDKAPIRKVLSASWPVIMKDIEAEDLIKAINEAN